METIETETNAGPPGSEKGSEPNRRNLVAILRAQLSPQRVWSSALSLWKALAGLTLAITATIAVIVVAMLLVQGLTRSTVAIEPISVPKELADRGYAPVIAASRLRDAMTAVVVRSDAPTSGPEIALRGEAPDIVVPTVGISVDSIVTVIRGFLHSNRRRSISGEFILAEGQLSLRLRLDGKQIHNSTTGGTLDRPDDLLAIAAPRVFKEIEPFTAGIYAYVYKDNDAQALAIVEDLIDSRTASAQEQADADLLRAWVYNNRGKYVDAMQAAEQAVRHSPNYAPAHTVLGNVFRGQRRYDEALVEYRKALQLDPKSSAPRTNMAGIRQAQGNYQAAIETWRALISDYPRASNHHLSLGYALRLQHDMAGAEAEFDKAIALLRRKVEADPGNTLFHSALGQALLAQRKFDEAESEHREAIRLEPGRAAAHVGLAGVLEEQHAFAEAAREVRVALQLDPDNAGSHAALSNMMHRLGEHDEQWPRLAGR